MKRILFLIIPVLLLAACSTPVPTGTSESSPSLQESSPSGTQLEDMSDQSDTTDLFGEETELPE